MWIDNTLSRTLLLGFDKANLVSTGRTTTGKLRPGRFLASVKPFFYDLADAGHLRALKATWHHLTAYAAGYRQRPYHEAYRLTLGQDRELCRTEYSPGQFEVLVASCYNQNYHEDDDPRLFAWDQDVRAAAWEQYYRRYPVVPGYCFQIYRVDREGNRLHVAQRGDRYEIPFSAIKAMAYQAKRVLRELWTYIPRHPSQVEKRYDAFPEDEWICRWQLYDPPAFNAFVGPDLLYAFAFEPDPSLFGVAAVELVPPQAIPDFTYTPEHPLEEAVQATVAVPTPAVEAPEPPRPTVVYWLVQVLERLLRWILSWGADPRPESRVEATRLHWTVMILVDGLAPPTPLARGPPLVRRGPAVPRGIYF